MADTLKMALQLVEVCRELFLAGCGDKCVVNCTGSLVCTNVATIT